MTCNCTQEEYTEPQAACQWRPVAGAGDSWGCQLPACAACFYYRLSECHSGQLYNVDGLAAGVSTGQGFISDGTIHATVHGLSGQWKPVDTVGGSDGDMQEDTDRDINQVDWSNWTVNRIAIWMFTNWISGNLIMTCVLHCLPAHKYYINKCIVIIVH